MCIAVPMKLVKINGVTGIAELGNLQREIGLLLVENANVGDYVIVHAGYARWGLCDRPRRLRNSETG